MARKVQKINIFLNNFVKSETWESTKIQQTTTAKKLNHQERKCRHVTIPALLVLFVHQLASLPGYVGPTKCQPLDL